jgi:pimeloyl-ACP methyl ester carboxylesterase
LIFAHGLLSTPHMWLPVMNAIRADPELRGRYQFWVFYYPTANPVPLSALALRDDLGTVERLYRPKHGFVLVGHSMGGLVCRMQVVNTGRVLWDECFNPEAQRFYAQVPADSLVKRALIFNANPSIKRIVFVCVPHRGSKLAQGFIGSLGMRLVRVPALVVRTTESTLGDAFTALLRRRKLRLPSSIQGLSPRSPVILGLAKLPIEAPHHSIIGDRGRNDRLKGSDGVVPYWSSHLDSAQSEKVIPAGHSGYRHPVAIAELVRILRLHLGSSDHAGNALNRRDVKSG